MKLLADLVVLLHAGFALFVVFGALLAWRWRWIPWVHLPAAAWGAYVEFASRICPLTPLENRLRAAGGAAAYRGDFIAHYLVPVLYPDNLTRNLQLALGTLVIVFNVLAYTALWRCYRRGRPRRPRGRASE